MGVSPLIPTPDTIPAPDWLFVVLGVFTFIVHILFINVILGGSLLLVVSRFRKDDSTLQESLPGAVAGKIPTMIALGITFGVAPLLFLQVIYGHFFYSSSVLMATYWILIIPLLIIAYYGAYVHIRKYSTAKILSKTALTVSALILLYIGFMFVQNMLLMMQPQNWTAYFENRNGTILTWSDATLLPRYLHFVTASIAIGGLFLAIVWWYRQKKEIPGADEKIKSALKIFGIATSVQVVVGFWFLLALPSNFILSFMGQNIFLTIVLFLGILTAIGAIISAFLGKLLPTTLHLVATIALMAITRQNLRVLYLQEQFNLSSLKLSPQYGVMALFFIVFAIGLAAVGYMAKTVYAINQRRAA